MNIGMAYFEFGGTKGVARVAAELTSRMARLGNTVHFYCAALPSPRPSEIHFHKVVAQNSFQSFGLASFGISARRSLRKGRHDITHSHGNIVGADVITAHSCHKASLRILRSSNNLGVADRIRLHLERKNYGERNCKRIIAVSEGVKRELIVEYNVRDNDVVVIPNGVDCERFTPKLRQTVGRELRERLKFTPDDFILIFVANEFERKGLKHAIITLSLLRTAHVKLIVVGNDNASDYIGLANQCGVLNRVRFLGSVQNIQDYYAMSDAFLFPTSYEAFSLATLEAAASGIPLLTTKVNGTEELINDGLNGFFIERHADDIVTKIVRLLNDRELREQLGANARLTAEQYSWDRITLRTLDLYRDVIAQ